MVSIYLGQRIRAIRECLGMGRQEFSDKCRIKKKSLENIEMGRQRAHEELITAVADNWPHFAYWLVTGLTQPEAGHVSPEIEEVRKKLERAG